MVEAPYLACWRGPFFFSILSFFSLLPHPPPSLIAASPPTAWLCISFASEHGINAMMSTSPKAWVWRPALVSALALLVLFLATGAEASTGDKLPAFRECVRVRFYSVSSSYFASTSPTSPRLSCLPSSLPFAVPLWNRKLSMEALAHGRGSPGMAKEHDKLTIANPSL